MRTHLKVLVTAMLMYASVPTAAQMLPQQGHVAPAFTLPDIDGKVRKVADFRGRPSLLAFFCGCRACQEFARSWAEMQRAGVLADNLPSDRAPRTVVVFMGTREEARGFAAAAALDGNQTTMLPDPHLSVVRLYNAQPCPRLFVLDANLLVRYANTHGDDIPQEASASALVARTLDALRGCRQAAGPGASRANSKRAAKSNRHNQPSQPSIHRSQR